MDSEHTQSAVDKHRLSRRGAYNFLHRDVWGPRQKSMGNPWSPANPAGTIILRLAENSLLHNEIVDFIGAQMAVLPIDHLTYSTGPWGSLRLRRAAASFLTDEFQSREPISAGNIFITPGLTSAVDALTWAICNEGDGILVPQPLYNGFHVDIMSRSNARIIGVSYDGIDGYSGLDDLFCPEVNKKAIEAALRKAQDAGITVRALLVTNPHNPLGRCYPPETLKVFASFCGKNGLHFISDEIYAKSVFDNPMIPNPTSFFSTLALDLRDVIDPALFHVLYGASKDFCANGLRIGFICTKNEGLLGAISSISVFSWSPHVVHDVWAAMLEDKQWRTKFMVKKSKLMSENYHIATKFFREHGIGYYEINAGLYIWVDLRHLITRQSDYRALKATAPEAGIYKERETKITEICQGNGVMIAPGNIYGPEEFGWFRVTFTVSKDALEEGLNRLWKSLLDVKAVSQDW